MSDDSRQQGVELGDLSEKLRDHEYPASQDELLEAYGDEAVELSEETTTFEELVGPLNEDEYGSYEEIEGAIMNMVGDEAIGRKNYSDRTPPAPGEDRQEEIEGAIMNMVGDEAIGRKNYSDRTPPAPGEDRRDEGTSGRDENGGQESF